MPRSGDIERPAAAAPAPPAESRHARELRLLQEISETVDRTVDLRTVVEPILDALAENMGFARSLITLLSRSGDSIWIEASRGLTPAQAALGRYRLGEGVVGRVVQSGEPLVVPDTARSPVFLNRTGSGKEHGTAFICVPIREHEHTLGALAVYRATAADEELEDDAGLLKIVASMLARALLLRREVQDAHDSLIAENRRLRERLGCKPPLPGLVGDSPAMQRVCADIGKVAPSNATVLVLGETGTGKELVARAIHAASPRAGKPFVAVHCAALPETLIESELFGHVKGAFTGAAAARKGRFALAEGGTLFLDEVGEIPLPAQTKLLRVLQERAFVPVGGETPVSADVRIIAATHRDLERFCAEGKFREDLYYRLNVFPLRLPPLAGRGNDILELAGHFISKYAKEAGRPAPALSPEAADALLRHPWPGNVRELENCMERALLLSPGATIPLSALPEAVRAPQPQAHAADRPGAQAPGGAGPGAPPAIPPRGTTLAGAVAELERAMIARALENNRWRTAAAARELGSTGRIVAYKARKYGITPEKTSSGEPSGHDGR